MITNNYSFLLECAVIIHLNNTKFPLVLHASMNVASIAEKNITRVRVGPNEATKKVFCSLFLL